MNSWADGHNISLEDVRSIFEDIKRIDDKMELHVSDPVDDFDRRIGLAVVKKLVEGPSREYMSFTCGYIDLESSKRVILAAAQALHDIWNDEMMYQSLHNDAKEKRHDS